MPNGFEFLQGVFQNGGPAGEEVRWEALEAALLEVASSPPAPEGEQLLLDIIRFEGRIELSPASELPHSLSPEDMLKSLAIQALMKWTGLIHLLEIQRARGVATSPMLMAVARAVAKEALQAKKTAVLDAIRSVVWDPQGFYVLQPGILPRVTGPRAVTRDKGMMFLPDQPGRWQNLEPVGELLPLAEWR